MRRFGRAVVCAFGLVVTAAQAPAQTYPSKPIRIIVPYAPGGLTDVVARLYSEQLRQSLGRGVFVENKPGASGIVAIEEMARARGDGHTLPSAFATSPRFFNVMERTSTSGCVI